MQKTIRILRVVLPIVFVAFGVLIAASYTRTARRAPTGESRTEGSIRQGDRPQLVSYTFEDTQSIGGRIVSRIRARRTTGFKSGWYALEDAHLTIYRKEGGTYELTAPLAQFHSKTKEAAISGGVRLSSSDGIEILTRELMFDGNRMMNKIPVEFTVNQWRGQAGGVDLDVGNDRLRLYEIVTAQMKPANPEEVPMHIGSQEAIFIRKFGEVKFQGSVTVSRGTDRLHCDWIQAHLDDRNEVLVELKGEGNVVVTLAPQSNVAVGSAATGGQKRVESDRFFTELGPRGEIRAINLIGEHGPARAFLTGPPSRTLTAQWLRVALDRSVLKELKADNGVVLEEAMPKGTRTLRAGQVLVYFDPVSRQATSSLIQGRLEYRDPGVVASAERANYDIVGDRMILTPVSGSLVTIVSQQNTIKASLVEFSPRDESMKASGNVSATLVSSGAKGGASAGETSLFPSGAPVYVNADRAIYRQASRMAVFTGNVRAWQELNTLLANELTVQGAGDQVNGRGAVKVVLYNSRGKETVAPAGRKPVLATGDSLIYRKAERRIDLVGNVRVEEMTRLLTANTARLETGVAKKLDRVDAEGNVHVADGATGRKGSGEKASYRVSEQMLYLEGSPAELTDPRGVLRGQKISYDITRNKAVVNSGSSPAESSYKPD